jgi:hypothetical protein
MRTDPAAKGAREQLRAQAQAEERLAGLEPGLDIVELGAQVGLFAVVVGALGAAVDDGADVLRARRRQGLALARAAPEELVALLGQIGRGAVVALSDRLVDQDHDTLHAAAPSRRRASRKWTM